MAFDPYYGNSTDEELLALGRASGVLPEEQPTRQDPATWAAQLDAPQPEIREDYHTWVPKTMGFTPNYEDSPGNIDMEAPAPVTQTPTSTSISTASSQSHSNSGFSKTKWGEVSGTDQELNQDLAASEAEAQQRENRIVEPTALAADNARVAEKQRAKAEIEAIAGKGEQALVLQRLQDEFAVEEAKATAQAQALANKSKTDYLTALADFRASRVDPSQLWQNMSGGERFGTLITAFVHDFLGAKGINTSAMATLNKAIDRNIDAQMAGIKVKGEVAEGFKSLYYMQRNQSADDAEARARVRGFLLEGAKQAVIANMSKYEAGLASAQGQQALAKIDEELAKNLVEIYKHSDANALALRNQAIEKWKTKLHHSMESWSNAISAKNAETNRMRADQEKTAGILPPEPIYNPETGKAEWIFHPWIQKEERAATRTLMEDLTNINGSFKELRRLTREMSSTLDPIARTRLADTLHQKYDALATRLGHSMAKANGERATDQDVKDFLKGMREKTVFNQADVEKVIAFTQEEILKPAYSKVKVMGRDALEEETKMFPMAAARAPFAGSLADAHNTSDPPAPTPQEIARGNAVELVAGASGDAPYTERNDEVKKAHAAAVKEAPDIFGDVVTKRTRTRDGEVTYETSAAPIRNFEKGMVELRRLARAGDKTAYEQLQTAAAPYLNGVSKDGHSVFAALMLSTMTEE